MIHVNQAEGSDRLNEQIGISSLDVLTLPWAFMQHYPLDADGFIA
jgi:hypothetical protein